MAFSTGGGDEGSGDLDSVPKWLCQQLPERYTAPKPLGEGGFAVVVSVFDKVLQRRVAMKVLSLDMCTQGSTRQRFEFEARMMAQMQHPGIVAVHDTDTTEGHAPWYTMRLVDGNTFEDVLAKDGAGSGQPRTATELRRLVGVVARTAQTVGYAHAKGLVHRDLKPSNIMVGQGDEVLVMDWGIAARLNAQPLPRNTAAAAADAVAHEDQVMSERLTRTGDALGTCPYMSPEQALGDRDAHCPATDVFALGCVLFEVLTGSPPYNGKGMAALYQAQMANVPDIRTLVSGPAPLLEICRRALEREPEARYADATELGAGLSAWLDGARRRAEADQRLRLAADKLQGIVELEGKLDTLRARAQQMSSTIDPQATETEKEPLWQLEDQITEIEHQLTVRMAQRLGDIQGALSIDGEHEEARSLLSQEYRAAIIKAERDNDERTALRFITLLEQHDKPGQIAFLTERGAVTLLTEPEGAEVVARRYQQRSRRLVLEYKAIVLGKTPLRGAQLQRGSYLLEIRHPACETVHYPVSIERGEHWDGVPPGENDAHPVRLPLRGELTEDDCYVPAGWSWLGGDDQAVDSALRQRVWLGGYVIKRVPVTQQQYIDLIDVLTKQGLSAQAEQLLPGEMAENSPRTTSADRSELSVEALRQVCVHGVYDAKSFVEGWPMVMVSWQAATMFAQALAQRSGLPWRLPHGLEREKAARGVDSRIYPWGQHADPAFCWVMESQFESASRQQVTHFRRDESPYGVRFLAGNTRDWCANPWLRSGPRLHNKRLTIKPFKPTNGALLTVRGGAWSSPVHYARSASRFALNPSLTRITTGFRLVRSFEL